MAITVSTKENAGKKTFGEKFAMPLDFDLFKNLVYPYGPKKDLFVSLELTSSEKVISWYRDTIAKYNVSDISLEYDAIFDECYDATTKYELYAETASQ